MGPGIIQEKAHPSLYSLELVFGSISLIPAERGNSSAVSSISCLGPHKEEEKWCTENGRDGQESCYRSFTLPKRILQCRSISFSSEYNFTGEVCSISVVKKKLTSVSAQTHNAHPHPKDLPSFRPLLCVDINTKHHTAS